MKLWQTTTDLYLHQKPPVEKLLPSRVGGLFMEMGTGKTRVAIELSHIRQHKIDRVVWCCPVSLKETIRYEILKHTDAAETDVYVFDDQTRSRNIPVANWYIVGLESLGSSNRVVVALNSLITESTFLIVDESSYIKGHRANRTQRITLMGQRARYRLVMTGTPLTQGIQDLFSQMRFLSPKILGYYSFYSFARNHLEYSEKYPGMIIRAHNTDWLASKMRPYVYQVTKSEAGLNLPPKLYDSQYFSLTDQQQEAYEQAKYEILYSGEDWTDVYVIFQTFTALQQIVSGFWRRDGELLEFPHRRIRTLKAVIESIPSDEKVIIWAKYHYSINAITKGLSEEYGPESVCQFYGNLTESQRAGEIARWRDSGRFLVATMATGGHGLTLNEASWAIFYENEFKYAHRIQAEDRNHRIGQDKRPTYIDIQSFSKIEDRISQSLARKGNVLDEFRRKVEAVKKLGKKEMEQYLRENL